MGNKSNNNRKKFFKEDLNANVSNKSTDMKEKVQIQLKIENSDSSNEYYIKVFSLENQNEKFMYETEKLKGKNGILEFQTTFILDYFFECEQSLIFKIYKDNKEKIINTTLGTIVGQRGNCLHKKIIDSEKEIINITALQKISIDESKGTHLFIRFYVVDDEKIKGLKFDDINNKFYYKIINKTDLYRSEDLSNNGTFLPIRIPLTFLSPNFTITFYNMKNIQLMTLNEITIESIINMNDTTLPLILGNKTINILLHSDYRNKITFLDYLENNLEIGLGISIDFTGSSFSLHNVSNGKSDYEKAIEACGKILAVYDSDQLFPVWGFGATNVGFYNENCFPINFKNNPEIYSIKGVIDQYHECLKRIDLSGPTYYAESMKNFVSEVKKQKGNKYNILLFLTDGENSDMNKTKDIICEAAKLPISIIIVGLGNHSFTNMIILDGDDEPLTDSNGKKCERDIVQFVPFNKYENDPNGLAKEVLAEIPFQVIDYYQSKGIDPEDL